MHLSVYGLDKTLFDGSVSKIIARAVTGEITVLENHIPLVTSVHGPHVTVESEEGRTQIPLQSGILEVQPNSRIVLLLDA